METGYIEIGLAHLQLFQNVVPHLLRRARRKRRNRQLRKAGAQPAKLAVLRSKLVSPLRNAMRLIDGKETHRQSAQPLKSISRRQPLRREIKQPIFAARGFFHHLPSLRRVLKTVDGRRRNAHLRQLRRLVLHERDQRRNHHRRLPRNHGRKLVAQRLPASSRHHHASVVRGQQAADDILLLGAKLVVSPIAAQHVGQGGIRGYCRFGHSLGSIALELGAKSVSVRHPICDE